MDNKQHPCLLQRVRPKPRVVASMRTRLLVTNQGRLLVRRLVYETEFPIRLVWAWPKKSYSFLPKTRRFVENRPILYDRFWKALLKVMNMTCTFGRRFKRWCLLSNNSNLRESKIRERVDWINWLLRFLVREFFKEIEKNPENTLNSQIDKKFQG